jgi:hypothetical protein
MNVVDVKLVILPLEGSLLMITLADDEVLGQANGNETDESEKK